MTFWHLFRGDIIVKKNNQQIWESENPVPFPMDHHFPYSNGHWTAINCPGLPSQTQGPPGHCVQRHGTHWKVDVG
jgi:hypothetical protein